MTKEFAISLPPSDLPPALMSAVNLWADAKTDADSRRRADLIRDKRNALVGDDSKGAAGFFLYIGKSIETVTPADVKRWGAYLEDRGLSASSVYARISRVCSFYNWLMSEPAFAGYISTNPVPLARPTAPKAYQSERSQALSDEDARALLLVVRAEAGRGSLHAKRDYALLRFFFATGKRRSEIINLHWGDLRLTDDAIILQSKEKGGLYRSTEIRDPGVRAALFDYLSASGRGDKSHLQADDPVWLRHDRAAKGGEALTSHSFARAFKGYARRAGLGDVHLHQTRHTVARMVGEQSGDLTEVQTVLGHQNLTTTRVYLERVAIKRDKHSRAIAGRLGLDDE
jgi:site-specific recombinase XerD